MEAVDSVRDKFQEFMEKTPEDFDSWTSLIAHIDKTYPNDLQKICLVYDAFLSEFPLCFEYWMTYARHKARLCELQEAEKIYARAVQVVTYSVDLWVSYCNFGVLTYEDPADIRRLFERGLSSVRRDYRCNLLWDKYIEFEHSQKNWSHLAHIFVRALQFPTRKLASYYDRFKSLINTWIEEVGYQDEPKAVTDFMNNYGQGNVNGCGYAVISKLISEFIDKKVGVPSNTAFKKYSFIGEQFYLRSSKIDKDISLFEGRIKRHYFHVKPLDDSQLETWHQYLDFVENQEDFEWIVKLYERCLIPCASYSEFWIRYVEFVDARGGRELANHALLRAETLFLKKSPSFRLYCAMYKEHIRDVSGARAIFLKREQDLTSEFIENVNREANMEKRMGNIGAAQLVYEKAIDLAKEKKNVQILPILCTNYARFMFAATGKTDAGRDMFIKGSQEVPCRSIFQALIQFMIVHGGAGDISKLYFIVSNAIDPESEISRALCTEDRECISRSYLEFLDLYGDIHEIRRAWGHHRKLFPHGTRPAFSDINKNKGDNNGTLQLNSKIVCLGNLSGNPDKHSLERVAQKDNANILSEGDVGCLSHQKEEDETDLMVTSDVKVHDETMTERDEPHVTINEPGDYSTDMAHVPILTESQILHSSDAVSPPSLDDLTVSCRDAESQQMKLNVLDSNYPQQATTTFCSGNVLDKMKVSPTSCTEKVQGEVKTDATETSKLESVDITSNFIAEANFSERETLLLLADPASKDTQINPVCQMELELQTNTQHDLPVITETPQKGSSTEHLDQTNYRRQASEGFISRSPTDTRTSKVQQWEDHAHAQYASAGYNSDFMTQAYPYQSQFRTNAQPLQANQNQGFDAYQKGFPVWSGQSAQMQASPCTVSQPNTQTAQSQTDIYQQCGYFPNSQGLAPHMWYYYHQQQQQNQQSNITEQKSQKHPQQQPADGHQFLLQPLQQQQNDNQMELQQNTHSSEKIPNQKHQHQQHASPSQQQGEPQQQAQQQQQQLLYMQQQQWYLQHQHQLFLQQQHFYQQLHQQQQHPHQKQEHQTQQQQQEQKQHPEGRYRQENKLSQLQVQQQQQTYQQQQKQQHLFQVNPHQQKHISGSEVQTSSSDVCFENKEAKLHDVEQSARSRSSTPQVPTRQ